MFCRNCGEENPENAVYCKNCGNRLIEEVKKAEVIEAPTRNQSSSTTERSDRDSSSWIGCCCLGVIVIFILAALFGI